MKYVHHGGDEPAAPSERLSLVSPCRCQFFPDQPSNVVVTLAMSNECPIVRKRMRKRVSLGANFFCSIPFHSFSIQFNSIHFVGSVSLIPYRLQYQTCSFSFNLPPPFSLSLFSAKTRAKEKIANSTLTNNCNLTPFIPLLPR